jgi:hypothetical protein
MGLISYTLVTALPSEIGADLLLVRIHLPHT